MSEASQGKDTNRKGSEYANSCVAAPDAMWHSHDPIFPSCNNSFSDFATVGKHEMNFPQLFTSTRKPYSSGTLADPNASLIASVFFLIWANLALTLNSI